MFIDEMSPGTEFTLEVSDDSNRQPLTFPCVVTQTYANNHSVLVAPIYHEEKLVNFEGSNFSIQAYTLDGEKLIAWRSCSVHYIHTKDKSYHVIASKEDGTKLNRRSCFRLNVDEYCNVMDLQGSFEAFLVNISSRGFCLSVPQSIEKNLVDVRLSYHDTLMDRDMQLAGHVVWKRKTPEGRGLYGCFMPSKPIFDRYIADRQRKMMGSGKNKK